MVWAVSLPWPGGLRRAGEPQREANSTRQAGAVPTGRAPAGCAPARATAPKLPARANFPSEEPVHFLSHPAPPPSSGLLHFLFSSPHSLFAPALPSTKAGSQCTHDKPPSSQGLLRRLRTHGHLFIQQSRTRGAGRCMAALEGLAENGPRAPFSKGRTRGGAEKGKRDLTHSRRSCSLRGS